MCVGEGRGSASVHPLPLRHKIHQMTIEYVIILNIWLRSSEFSCVSDFSVTHTTFAYLLSLSHSVFHHARFPQQNSSLTSSCIVMKQTVTTMQSIVQLLYWFLTRNKWFYTISQYFQTKTDCTSTKGIRQLSEIPVPVIYEIYNSQILN